MIANARTIDTVYLLSKVFTVIVALTKFSRDSLRSLVQSLYGATVRREWRRNHLCECWVYDLTYCACSVALTRTPVHPHNRACIALKESVKVNVRVLDTPCLTSFLTLMRYLPVILENLSASENESQRTPFLFLNSYRHFRSCRPDR